MMPIIEVNLLEGRTTEQKNDMALSVTNAVVESLGVDRKTVRITVKEHLPQHFYLAGESVLSRQNKSESNIKEAK